MEAQTHSTVDAEEIAKFSAMAADWWNPEGKFKPLHRINPLRIQWILDQMSGDRCRMSKSDSSLTSGIRHPASLKGLRLLDIGCGGGLIAEPMARLGAHVTAIDASEKNIAVAKLHAEQSGLEIDYRCMTAEELVARGSWLVAREKENQSRTTSHEPRATLLFDLVLALEIIEHVADVEAFVAASCALLKPGGIIIYSTLNRTLKSFALAIAGAEYALRWLPRGTHHWERFLRPSELCAHLRHNNIEVTAMTGMAFNPLTGEWRLDAGDLGVNYLVVGRKLSSRTQ